MFNGKFRCIESDSEHFTEGRIYNFRNGKTTKNNGWERMQYTSIKDFESNNVGWRFEEVKNNKIILLIPNEVNKTMRYGNYGLVKTSTHNEYKLYVYNGNLVQYIITWGKFWNTTLEDVKPILDALNIEIKEEEPKYEIDIEGEYSKDELKKLEELGLKFKIKGD